MKVNIAKPRFKITKKAIQVKQFGANECDDICDIDSGTNAIKCRKWMH
jgi:hypothetical protein